MYEECFSEGTRHMPFTEEQLTAMRGGLTAEEYRWRLIRKWCKDH
jgi:hypothetical protein